MDDPKRAGRLAIPGLKQILETRWRPMWKAIGAAEVANQVMARRGAAVDDSAWGPHKIAEAEIWVNEELAHRDKSERFTRRMAQASFVVSLGAVAISFVAFLYPR